MCKVSVCKADIAYAVVHNNSIKRVSFSKSLCTHITSKVTGAKVIRVKIRPGKVLNKSEKSKTGLYAIGKKSNGWPLRVTMFDKLANHWRHETRDIKECSVSLT